MNVFTLQYIVIVSNILNKKKKVILTPKIFKMKQFPIFIEKNMNSALEDYKLNLY